MDKKIEKLLALYKDKSITIEEKRSIAVKLVDMGVLEGGISNSNQMVKEMITFTYDGKKHKDIDIHKLFEMLTILVIEGNLINNKLVKTALEVYTKNEEIDKLKSTRKWLTFFLVINAVIAIIKILN